MKSNGDVISSFEYGYNWNGNIVSVTDKNGNTTNYDYDKENRLTSVEYPTGLTMKYKYDKKDNLAEKKRMVDGKVVNTVNNEYDEENRLIRSNDKTYSYDKDGNQIRAGDMSFDYMTSRINGKNVKRLKSVSESGEHVASYSYTLEGQRTGKYLDSGESEISYHYDGRNVQYEQWSSGRTVRYTHPIEGGSSCSSCGCGGSSGVFTDHPISIKVNGTKYYYLYNGQGSVTELINADEEVVNKYRYTPFGSPRLKVESVYNPYEYTGRRLDEETGQYYYRARMYSTEQCRFTTQDPAGMQEGPNMYAYVGNNPVNHRDPSGMVSMSECLTLCSLGGCAALCGMAAYAGLVGAVVGVGCGVACWSLGCGTLCGIILGDGGGTWPDPIEPPQCDPQTHQCLMHNAIS